MTNTDFGGDIIRQRQKLTPDNAQLIILNGKKPQHIFALKQMRIIIGRSQPPIYCADIDLTDFDENTPSSISRRHAELKWVDEKLQIIDLNSSNGTFVEGEKLHPLDVNNPPTPVILHHGSKLKLGNLEMKIQESSML
ncbi:FHA domain-containing protein [Cyanobacterium aponinum]|uniref:FHA domain-containing protein n=1 Tax=Cyanobacterium aponinum 0216 TaxID=2676140 RepID=A0A844GXN4_9CHRO|nr:FHA domain-containing protein [Cyanobacterium aponinum]MTF40323.1 FHA domain-containing protein [Cyanobacterium aponinum 0216]